MSSGLLQVFVELRNLHGTSNYVLYWIRVGSRVQQTPEEVRRTYRPKHCVNNNKHEDNSPKTLNDMNQQALSQKFRQLVLVLCEMQLACSSIWTPVTVSISYDDNHYTTGTSTKLYFSDSEELCMYLRNVNHYANSFVLDLNLGCQFHFNNKFIFKESKK